MVTRGHSCVLLDMIPDKGSNIGWKGGGGGGHVFH